MWFDLGVISLCGKHLLNFDAETVCQAVRLRLWQKWWSGLHVRAVNARACTHLYTWRHCSLTSAPGPLLVCYVCTLCVHAIWKHVQLICWKLYVLKPRRSDQRLQRLPPQFSQFPSSETSVCPLPISLLKKMQVKNTRVWSMNRTPVTVTGGWNPICEQGLPSRQGPL